MRLIKSVMTPFPHWIDGGEPLLAARDVMQELKVRHLPVKEDGELVSIDGSWTAGVEFAKPGIVMKRNPAIGDVYRQEFALGEAEDAGKVLSLTASAVVLPPGASCDNDCLKTKDFSPLEPDADERKYYKPGVGLILEVNRETGERVELVDYSMPE